jgi:hypothetical protein
VSAQQVDHDLLADYVGGALEGTPAHDEVAHLVATDPAWRGAYDQLNAALSLTARDLALLRDTPEPMPADVAERILSALEPTPPPRSRPFIHKLRWAVPIAVAAAAFAFVAIKLPASGTSQSTSAPAMKAPEAAADAAGSASAEPVPTITSGKQHNRASLRTLTYSSTDTKAAPQSSRDLFGAQSVPALDRLRNPQALKACLDAVALVLPGKPTLVDYAYFEGNPALVISITATDGKWTFVAGPDCGLAGPDEIFRAPQQ